MGGETAVLTGDAACRTAGILLVDDLEDNLCALEAVLSPLGEPLVRARSGEEAVEALRRADFAVVLLDVATPESGGFDGFETAARLKRLGRARGRDVPVVFLTGDDVDADGCYAFRGYATGAADYVAKPFDPWVLRAKVSVFLDLYRKERQLGLLRRQRLRDEACLDEAMDRLAEVEAGLSGDDTGLAELRSRVAGVTASLRALRYERGCGGEARDHGRG